MNMKKYSQEGCFFLCVFSTHSETSHYDENTSIWKYCIPKKTKHSSQKQKLFFRTSLECISFNLKFVIRRTHRISSRKYKFASNKRCEFSLSSCSLIDCFGVSATKESSQSEGTSSEEGSPPWFAEKKT